MLLKKEGFPEENELVLCTVTAIHFHSVFAKIDEYDKSGMIHISEISPGRIRNIRDYVKEGKVIVCKVLNINQEKGHIDLSLRRVNEGEKRRKINEVKQQQVAEKIIEFIAKKHKKEPINLYQEIWEKLSQDYDHLFTAFEDISMGVSTLEEYKIDKKISKELTEIIQQRIKPPEVKIEGDLTINSYESNGVEIVKNALIKGKSIKGHPTIKYIGGGKYRIKVIAPEFKEAESILKTSLDTIKDHLESNNSSIEFERIEN